MLGNTTAVLSLESNLAFESQHILHSLGESKVKKWVSMSEGAQGGLGWLTTKCVIPTAPTTPAAPSLAL